MSRRPNAPVKPSPWGAALNLTALIDLERAAEAMADFSFSAVERTQGYRAALKAFCSRKRRLRNALATWADKGVVKFAAGAAREGASPK